MIMEVPSGAKSQFRGRPSAGEDLVCPVKLKTKTEGRYNSHFTRKKLLLKSVRLFRTGQSLFQ